MTAYETILATIGRDMDAQTQAARADIALLSDARDAALRRVAELEASAPTAWPPAPLRVLQPRTMGELKNICTTTAEPGDLIDLGGLTFSDGGTLKVTRSGTGEHPIVFSNGEVRAQVRAGQPRRLTAPGSCSPG